MKSIRKFNNVTTTIKFFTFYGYVKEYILLEYIVWENAVYTITFLVIFF